MAKTVSPGVQALRKVVEDVYADARKGGLTPELRPLMTIIFLVVLVSLLFINLRNNRAAQKS